MDPYPPPRRVRIDTGMAIEVQHDGVVWVDEVVHPVFLVGLAPPGPGQSAGPKSIPLAITAAGALTEASASAIAASLVTINTSLLNQVNANYMTRPPYFTVINGGNAADSVAAIGLLLGLGITADGSGNTVATDIVPGLAGYIACMELFGFWTSAADASGTFTLSSTTGITEGPTVFVLTTEASKVAVISAAQQGVVVKNTVVAESIKLATTGIGANCVVWPIGRYWYEKA